MKVYVVLALSIAGILLCSCSKTREITDMAGRKVVIPKNLTKVAAPSPYGFAMLYSVAPEKLAGYVMNVSDEAKKYLVPAVHNLPMLGRISNVEAFKEVNPELIIVWGDTRDPIHQPSEERLAQLGIPHVYVCVGDLADLPDYPAAYEFMGKLMNEERRAAKLADYCRDMLKEVDEVMAKTAGTERPKVYYAEGPEGLQTEYDDSLHVHILKLLGDLNVRKGKTTSHGGMEPITVKEVEAYEPDVILAMNKDFAEKVYSDPKWKNVKAVQNKKVFLVPSLPFNWFDRPPSFMRILGTKWVMSIVYPETYKVDMVKETIKFYKLFLDVKITEEDAKAIMHL